MIQAVRGNAPVTGDRKKAGANWSDVNRIGKLAAKGHTVEQISNITNIQEQFVKNYMPADDDLSDVLDTPKKPATRKKATTKKV